MDEDQSQNASPSSIPPPEDSPQMKTAEFDSRIQVVYKTEDGIVEEETLNAHRLVLSAYSPFFQQLLQDATSSTSTSTSSSTSSESDDPSSVTTTIKLDLTGFQNALNAIKVILEALYTGEIQFKNGVTPSEVLQLTRHCQISGLDTKIMAATGQLNLANMLQCSPPFLQYAQSSTSQPLQNYLSNMINLWTNPFFSALFGGGQPPALPFSPPSDTENSRTHSEGSSPRANSTSTPPTTDLEKIVPNDDKEGWCRNKKYIEKVEGGFMCTVCRKIYGRYNSVSYHVTIYHRNPPIKCEENGCNFSTREARYIHFHKYYRHHIPLPENIDLGSRKCPFCRHVSKSPAMLEKHIARHETEGSASGSPSALKRAPSKKKIVPTTLTSDVVNPVGSIFAPITTNPSGNIPIQCSLCTFSTNSTDLLFIHLAMQHTQELAQSSGLLADNSSETSTASSSDGEQMMTDMDLDVKPLIDQSLMLQLNTPLSN
ncbi:unnamed protein product [Caenorhabditis brenneri]